MDVDGERFDHALEPQAGAAACSQDTELTPPTCASWSASSWPSCARTPARDFPTDPYQQLDLAIKAVFASLVRQARQRLPQQSNKIAHDLGTAVNVVTMVFGNMGDDSGTGVAFTRDPNTGEKVLFGEYLTNAQGEDVVAGIRTAPRSPRWQTEMPEVYAEFQRIGQQLEQHYRDVQDLEFTIERGRLYMLQTRSAKRTAAAAVRSPSDMVEEGLITQGGGRRRASSRRRSTSCCATSSTRRAQGRARASPRASTRRPARPSGGPCSTPTSRSSGSARGEQVVLVRIETSARRLPRHGRGPGHPDRARRRDLARRGRGAPDRQALRRGLRRAGHRLRAPRRRAARRSGLSFSEGDWISLDGSTGEVFLGALPTVAARFEDQPDLQKILGWADEIRRLGVWTNADKPEEAAQARSYGAQGIGLCRTEHMFREGERLEIVRGAILVANQATRAKARSRRRRDASTPTTPTLVATLRRGDGQARGAPAGRLRGHLQGHGRPAGGHPAHRPAAPRVPAQPRGAAGQGDQGRRRRHGRRTGELLRDHPVDARAEPDAGPARLPAGADDPRLRQDPDAGHPERPDRGQAGRAATPSPRS